MVQINLTNDCFFLFATLCSPIESSARVVRAPDLESVASTEEITCHTLAFPFSSMQVTPSCPSVIHLTLQVYKTEVQV